MSTHKNNYSYLKDPRAVSEIRKHKWIESQKQKKDIGFGAAALDWIQKYGEKWKRIHVKKDNTSSTFFERRKYRRFKPECSLKVAEDKNTFPAKVMNLNFLGLQCKVKEFLPLHKRINISLETEGEASKSLKGMVGRIFPYGREEYEMFIQFDQDSQREMEEWGPLRKVAV